MVVPMTDETESVCQEEPPRDASKAFPWAAIVWFGVLLVACYAPVLWRLVRQWATDGPRSILQKPAWSRRRSLEAD